VPASNLTTALTTYNPGWGTPIGTSSWIGSSPTANQFTVLPGSYLFRTTFTIPAGATGPLLNLTSLVDNSELVFLNGYRVDIGTVVSDCPDPITACSWNTPINMYDNIASHFNIGGTNTLDVIVVNTFAGQGPPGGPNPVNSTTCQFPLCINPSGVDFSGTVSYTPAARPVALFVIGDVEAHNIGANVNFWGAQWWKNNTIAASSATVSQPSRATPPAPPTSAAEPGSVCPVTAPTRRT